MGSSKEPCRVWSIVAEMAYLCLLLHLLPVWSRGQTSAFYPVSEADTTQFPIQLLQKSSQQTLPARELFWQLIVDSHKHLWPAQLIIFYPVESLPRQVSNMRPNHKTSPTSIPTSPVGHWCERPHSDKTLDSCCRSELPIGFIWYKAVSYVPPSLSPQEKTCWLALLPRVEDMIK